MQTNHSQTKILVMDDDSANLDAFATCLSLSGYLVVKASTGEEAISEYQKALSAKKIDLLLLDLTVEGGVGGLETLQELIKIDPQVKAIAVSGYTTNPVITNPTHYNFINALAKPCLPEKLLKIIEEALNQ